MTCCFFPLALGSGFMDGVFGLVARLGNRAWRRVFFAFDSLSCVICAQSLFFLASCAVQGLQ